MGGEPLTLLLDTHVIVRWAVEPDRLPPAHRLGIERALAAGERLGIAAVTLWEIAMLVARQRLHFDDGVDVVLHRIERNPQLAVLPLDARVAVESTRLGDRIMRDPADQLIVATARVHQLRLVTADERIRQSGAVSVL